MSGVANWYAQHSLGELQRCKLYHDVKKGLENFFGLSESSEPRTAFTFDDIKSLVDQLNPNTFDGARDIFHYLISFYGLLRRSETGARMTWAHVIRHTWGLDIIVPYSKTNLRPITVRLAARGDRYCPLVAFDHYSRLVHAKLRHRSLPLLLSHADRSLPIDIHAANTRLVERMKINNDNINQSHMSVNCSHCIRLAFIPSRRHNTDVPRWRARVSDCRTRAMVVADLPKIFRHVGSPADPDQLHTSVHHDTIAVGIVVGVVVVVTGMLGRRFN